MSSPDQEKPQDEAVPVQGKHNALTRFLGYKLYPRAHEANLSINDPAVRTSRLGLARAAAKNFVFLQALFFALFCYIFGALYQQNNRINHFNVAFVDYDGGSIGGALRTAYHSLEGKTYPQIVEWPRERYPDPSDIKDEVCKIRYWAGLYVNAGASALVENALAANRANYNKTAVMQYIWNEARYGAINDASLAANLQLLSNTAKPIWAANRNWTSIIPNPNENTYSTFANPWVLANDNILVTIQGTRLVYNTLVIILLLIQEFFYLGTLNQLYEMSKIYTKLSPHRIIFFRTVISLAYCFIGSLCVTGTIWIFKTGWNVNGNQFVLTWMVLWLFAHLNFLTLDVFTVWLPPPFVPMALVAWLVFNVTSILLPFELVPDFYRWSYAMPAHEVYNTLIDIWSRGCNPVLRYSLPILFAYEVSSFILAGLGIHRRCHFAIIRAEAEQAAFEKRMEAALALEKKRHEEDKLEFERRLAAKEARIRQQVDAKQGKHDEEEELDEDIARDREEARKDIENIIAEDQRRMRELPLQSPGFSFGPSFGFGFTSANAGRDDDGSNGAEMGRSRTFGGRIGGMRKRRGSIS